ncbi:MAG: response regulator [Candidatus Rokuibacteriota bacterium]|nr:MAG: response regulator [Candidatus Rokubacteria bacterium]
MPSPSRADTKPLVLLIDDERDVLDVLQECVESIGYATVTARNGVAGLAAARAEPPPDAVLLDIAMPGALDGAQTLRAIKAHSPSLPVIMVTANSDLSLAQGTLRDGALDYLMKPVEIARLREVLMAAMAVSGKAAPPE